MSDNSWGKAAGTVAIMAVGGALGVAYARGMDYVVGKAVDKMFETEKPKKAAKPRKKKVTKESSAAKKKSKKSSKKKRGE